MANVIFVRQFVLVAAQFSNVSIAARMAPTSLDGSISVVMITSNV